MIIILSLIGLLIIGLLIAYKTEYEITGLLLIGSSVILLFMGIITFCFQHIKIKSQIKQYYAIEQTLITARERNNDFENAALQQKIIEINQWIANVQYYNTTIFDIWVPDEVDELKLLQ